MPALRYRAAHAGTPPARSELSTVDPADPPRVPSGLRRDFRKSRRVFLAVVLAASAGLAVGQRMRAEPWVAASVTTTPGTVRRHLARRVPPAVVPASAGTSGRFAYVHGYGPVLGTAGPVRRFRVAVELPAPAAADFAHQVDRALGDPRSWIAGRRFRLRRVPGSGPAEFTVYLASARTSKRMCLAGGLRTDGYTSCRLPGRVIINDSRWTSSVPDYGAPLATYRAYAINHEVGHQLGHGHEKCPGRGRPAPVMMQQTYGLRGCLANSWPYRNGERWTGPPTP
jgi:hypothetical protein